MRQGREQQRERSDGPVRPVPGADQAPPLLLGQWCAGGAQGHVHRTDQVGVQRSRRRDAARRGHYRPPSPACRCRPRRGRRRTRRHAPPAPPWPRKAEPVRTRIFRPSPWQTWSQCVHHLPLGRQSFRGRAAVLRGCVPASGASIVYETHGQPKRLEQEDRSRDSCPRTTSRKARSRYGSGMVLVGHARVSRR